MTEQNCAVIDLGNFNADRTVSSVHNSNVGKVSNKWTSYLPYYDATFDALKDKPVRMLEIGVQNGGSLETWSRYFANATQITGCDIDQKCGLLTFSDPRINVVVGDANSPEVYSKLTANGAYDIVIDDGSHLSNDILIGFLNYFPYVKPGGLYVIEDTHAIYMDAATGINNKRTAFGFFKDLTDVVNFQFWSNQKSISEVLDGYLNVPVPAWLNDGWVDSIEFRNSIITVRKSLTAGHSKLGVMHVTGNRADVDGEPLRIKNIMAARAKSGS